MPAPPAEFTGNPRRWQLQQLASAEFSARVGKFPQSNPIQSAPSYLTTHFRLGTRCAPLEKRVSTEVFHDRP